MQLRFGILGTGNIARQFAEGVAHASRCALASVGSRDEAKAREFASKYSIARSHGSYDALLADDTVDAVYLSLPNSMHHEWAIKALRAGKHVLCEKPIAASAVEAREMFEVARSTKRTLVEAFMYRAHPQTHAVLDSVRSGAIGQLKLARLSFCFRVRNTQGNIRFDPRLAGGAAMDVGCYCINFARALAGAAPVEIRSVSVMHPNGVDEQTSAVLRFANHLTAEFTCGMSVQADNTAHLCGDEGYLTVGWPWKPAPPSTYFTLAGGIPPRQDNPGGKPVAPEPRQVHVPNAVPLYALEADAFAATVLDGVPSFMPEAETIDNMKVLDAIRREWPVVSGH
jgi:D-xylose 1-dehydrogenase (NADP+, D-xylono-1,5-lactone-forming)